MHALEWIEKHASRVRTMSLSTLRVRLKRDKGRCTWCDEPIGGGYRNWCSYKCRDEGYVRGGFWAQAILKRDNGVCAICGLKTLDLKARVERIVQVSRDSKRCFTYSRIQRWCRSNKMQSYRTPYEIDHIVPVSEGGGCCGLDNLRTVCVNCHKKLTAELAARNKKPKIVCGQD